MTVVSAQDEKVAVVTGAGSGIGRATALRLASDGYRIALVGRRAHLLQETADLIGPDSSSLVWACDVTDGLAVAAMVRPPWNASSVSTLW